MARTFSNKWKKSGSFKAEKADDASEKTDKLVEMTTGMRRRSSMRKSFKKMKKASVSFKGVLTGESRKERKARKAAARAAAAAEQAPSLPPSDSDEEETVYGVDLLPTDVLSTDVPSTPPRSSNVLSSTGAGENDAEEDIAFLTPPILESSESSTKPLQVVLLLMDPNTRRFELLQLEFDSSKAIVGDVLSEAPRSVTEKSLRKQKYVGVCDRHGVEMINSMNLSEFCTKNDVVLAIPEGTPSKDCAHLARPILSDPNVIEMLRSSGIEAPLETPEITPRAAFPPEKIDSAPTSGRKILSVLIVAALAIVATVGHNHITGTLSPGDELTPGSWRSKCGLLSFLPSQATVEQLSLPPSISSFLFCDNAALEMSRDGVLTLYGAGGSVGWKMEGSVCDHDHPSCVDGLTVKPNGALVIGGKQISSVTTYNDVELSPWPFAEAPKVRVVKRKN